MNGYLIFQIIQMFLIDLFIVLVYYEKIIVNNWNLIRNAVNSAAWYLVCMNIINTIVFIINMRKPSKTTYNKEVYYFFTVPVVFIFLAASVIFTVFPVELLFYKYKIYGRYFVLLSLAFIIAVTCPVNTVLIMLNKSISNMYKLVVSILLSLTSILAVQILMGLNFF